MKKIIFSLGLLSFLSSRLTAQDLPQVGWIETVVFQASAQSGAKTPLPLKAKVDTGAKTSSLNAVVKNKVVKLGQTYVQFTTKLEGKTYDLEAPLYKMDRVKTSDADEGEAREFVSLEVCVGQNVYPIVVSLNDRSKMVYPALLGRGFLENRFLVNSAKKNLQGKALCNTL